MNVEIGTELAQFHFWEQIMGFSLQCGVVGVLLETG
jgi:hypothetical protein